MVMMFRQVQLRNLLIKKIMVFLVNNKKAYFKINMEIFQQAWPNKLLMNKMMIILVFIARYKSLKIYLVKILFHNIISIILINFPKIKLMKMSIFSNIWENLQPIFGSKISPKKSKKRKNIKMNLSLNNNSHNLNLRIHKRNLKKVNQLSNKHRFKRKNKNKKQQRRM